MMCWPGLIYLTSTALGHASVDMTQKSVGISDEEVAAAILHAASLMP
jgi:hypothetical protein